MRWKSLDLTGWGRVHHAMSLTARPERLSDLAPIMAEMPPRGLAVYGAGRSYGDSALNSNGQACLTERLNRILGFDENTGIVDVEPGVTFRRLMDVFLPKGWLVPVTPGTSFVTIAGAVAHDVHGKNHEHEGTFCRHVTELDLLAPDGVVHTLRPTSKPEWFRATCGGCGLTGIITRIAFRLRRVASAHLHVTKRRIENLDAFMQAFEEVKNASYSVGWIDSLATGDKLGRGILETAEPLTDGNFSWPREKGRALPFDFPSLSINPISVKTFNALYLSKVPSTGLQQVMPYPVFLYPLDAIARWNRIYGRRGFHQFQCVVPYTDGQIALKRLLETCTAAGAGSFLTVLKRLGSGREGYLSFPMEGYTLAIDFPNRPATEPLYRALVNVTLEHGGRIYLAKDALLWPEAFERMYPELPDFRRVLSEIDPQARIQSDMARRLHVRLP